MEFAKDKIRAELAAHPLLPGDLPPGLSTMLNVLPRLTFLVGTNRYSSDVNNEVAVPVIGRTTVIKARDGPTALLSVLHFYRYRTLGAAGAVVQELTRAVWSILSHSIEQLESTTFETLFGFIYWQVIPTTKAIRQALDTIINEVAGGVNIYSETVIASTSALYAIHTIRKR